MIKLESAQKEALIAKLQAYCLSELDVELGQFDGEFLLDFIAKEFGSAFYNQGVLDAQAVVLKKADDIADALSELEKPSSI